MGDERQWSGYVHEIEYTHGYCSELAPAMLDLALLSRGIAPPQGRPLRYLELAFGQGVSINIHAAACPGEYWGFDLNEKHVDNANDLTAAAGCGARLCVESFEAFLTRNDVPQFDVIAMHGTWSWISAVNRGRVVEIVRRHLAAGGAFFMSYNCWPGWAAQMPLRHLLVEHVAASTSKDGLESRIDASLAFAQGLADAGAKFFETHPDLKAWLANMQARSRRYLAHEYFNRDWHPMPFSESAGEIEAAGVSFACSTLLADSVEVLGMSAQARLLLQAQDDPKMRETTLDYLVNRRFRKDIFVKQPRRLGRDERDSRLRKIAFTLLQPPGDIALKADTANGSVELPKSTYEPLIAALAEDAMTPKTLGAIETHPLCSAVPFEDLVQALVVLAGAGSVHPVQSPKAIEAATPLCRALNRRILERAIRGDEIAALASPVTGGGIFVAREEMMFLDSLGKGAAVPDDWARHAWESLGAGDPSTLRAHAATFARVRLPVLQALGVA